MTEGSNQFDLDAAIGALRKDWSFLAPLTVVDGATRYAVPVAEIESLTAAGNYVEVGWRERTLLHRSTLGALESEFGNAFVRIHRGALVRREAVRSVSVDRTGDFVATLVSGRQVRGSRRFRGGVETMLA